MCTGGEETRGMPRNRRPDQNMSEPTSRYGLKVRRSRRPSAGRADTTTVVVYGKQKRTRLGLMTVERTCLQTSTLNPVCTAWLAREQYKYTYSPSRSTYLVSLSENSNNKLHGVPRACCNAARHYCLYTMRHTVVKDIRIPPVVAHERAPPTGYDVLKERSGPLSSAEQQLRAGRYMQFTRGCLTAATLDIMCRKVSVQRQQQ